MAHYFRYNFIIGGRGSLRGRSYRVTVHSLFFSFSKKDLELVKIAQGEAFEIYRKVVPDWFIRGIGEGWEKVEPHEAKGIGFYYLHVLLNDKLVKKVHLRRRFRRRSFFSVVLRALYGLAKRLL